ncbi:hypothetical protein ACQEVS_11070 [Streptomyces sp. CA-181903]|uniref:hypothetical protein n=1 Tax=Streptomyces sp. CA-181903 TaxID=3240055 RepID=UPI003D8A8CD5
MIEDDIAGLKKVATDYTSATEKYDTTSKVLDKKVSGVVHEAGWAGDGADAFQTVWAHDGTIGAALAEAMSRVSDVVTVLSEELERAKHDLGDAQDMARAAGLTLDGQGGAKGTTDQQAALDAYRKDRDAALQRAQDARTLAGDSLRSVLDQMLNKGNPNLLNGADSFTWAEILRGLYTTPAALTQESAQKLAKLRQEVKDLKRQARKLPKNSGAWDKMLADRRSARAALSEQRLRTASVQGWQQRVKGSATARVTIGDIAEKYRVRGAGPVVGRFGAVSTGLTGAMVGLQMYDDHRTRGWSWRESFARDATPAAVGMWAGAGAESLIVGASASNPVVAVGVLGGVAVGYGVGTFGYELTHAHWGDKIHKYGVLKGIGYSIGEAGGKWIDNDLVDMKDKTVETAKKVGSGIKGGVKKAWHGIFG